jgi:hypothetical protein
MHFEPSRPEDSIPAQEPATWEEHLTHALQLPTALAEFLTSELGLATSGNPPAHVAVRLEAQHDLAEMINVTRMPSLPGSQHKCQATGYFIASSHGLPPADAAKQMITDVLRYALNVDV